MPPEADMLASGSVYAVFTLVLFRKKVTFVIRQLLKTRITEKHIERVLLHIGLLTKKYMQVFLKESCVAICVKQILLLVL